VCNDNRRPFLFGKNVIKSLLDDELGLRVQSACGLVQQQNSWVGNEDASNGNALFLCNEREMIKLAYAHTELQSEGRDFRTYLASG